ncbi:MAG: hypothetical protein ROR55_28895 [Devosia sp.]
MKTLIHSAAVAAVIASGFAFAAPTANAASMSCSVPNAVVCTITSRTGIKSVRVTGQTPFGVVNLVDRNYRGCPRRVKVSWDSAFSSKGRHIVECRRGGMGLKLR